MNTPTDTKTITFPPLLETEAAQILKLIPTMQEFMDVEIYPREVVIKTITVEIPADRADVIAILNKLAESKKPKRNFKTPRGNGKS